MVRPLGELVGFVLNQIAQADAFYDDPITVAYGMGDEMSPLVWKGCAHRVEVELRREGFDSFAEFLAVVEARTSARWVYFSGMHVLSDDHGFAGFSWFFGYQRTGELLRRATQ